MKILGVMKFLTGMFTFATGWIFLDLASLPLKKDLYTIDFLGFFNTLFSLDPSLASFQSIMAVLFILMGCFICYAGSIMVREQ